jgi:hypothetical protein
MLIGLSGWPSAYPDKSSKTCHSVNLRVGHCQRFQEHWVRFQTCGPNHKSDEHLVMFELTQDVQCEARILHPLAPYPVPSPSFTIARLRIQQRNRPVLLVPKPLLKPNFWVKPNHLEIEDRMDTKASEKRPRLTFCLRPSRPRRNRSRRWTLQKRAVQVCMPNPASPRSAPAASMMSRQSLGR